MNLKLLIAAAGSLAVGFGLVRACIHLASRWGLVDIPSSRRRHPHPMPIIGGVGVFATWAIGVGLFSALSPEWFLLQSRSLGVLGLSVAVLIGLGLYDDLKGASPIVKLFWQAVAAGNLMIFEPNVHAFCIQFADRSYQMIWPIVALWLIGLSNAINLVDGLDGLAGGISLLVACALSIHGLLLGESGQLVLALSLFLVVGIVPFLAANWHPARIFMGDNGSLPMGFLIGALPLTVGASGRPTVVQGMAVVLMMAYPIIDMGLCTRRRFLTRNPLFKADRSHLHHRLLRLGLTVPQTAILILIITLQLELAALGMLQFRSVRVAAGFSLLAGLSVFALVHLLRIIERYRSLQLASQHTQAVASVDPGSRQFFRECTLVKIDLSPLFEVGLMEEKDRLKEILKSMLFMLQSFVRKEDLIQLANDQLILTLVNRRGNPVDLVHLRKTLQDRLVKFQQLYQVQYSLASLPMSFERIEYLMHGESPQKKENDGGQAA